MSYRTTRMAHLLLAAMLLGSMWWPKLPAYAKGAVRAGADGTNTGVAGRPRITLYRNGALVSDKKPPGNGSAHAPISTPTRTTPPTFKPLLPLPSQKLIVSLESPPIDTLFTKDLILSGCNATTQQARYQDDLHEGLTMMAHYINHFSGGNVQISDIIIDPNGDLWERADIRILTNSSYRPTAFIGGQIRTPTVFNSPTTGRRVVFKRGPILIGRLWDGSLARCGPWSDPNGWRTLAHEWAHYALYLYDEYINLETGKKQYCVNNPPPSDHQSIVSGIFNSKRSSLMAYHYITDRLSGFDPSLPEYNCASNHNHNVHGGSAWQTLGMIYGWEPTSSAGYSGPTITVITPTASSASTSVSTAPMICPNTFGPAYLIWPSPSNSIEPGRIIGEGTLWPWPSDWDLRFWGLQHKAQNRAVAVLQNPHSGARLVTPPNQTLATYTKQQLVLVPSSWKPRMLVTPLLARSPAEPIDRVVGLEVVLQSTNNPNISPQPNISLQPASGTPRLSYCPAAGDCQPMSLVGEKPGQWTYRLALAHTTFAEYGYIYARQSIAGGEEAVIWYQQAGGVGPAHSGGLAPLAEGLLNVEVLQNSPQLPRNLQVIYGSALLKDSQTLATANQRILDVPMWISVFPGNLTIRGLRVRLNYSQDVLDRLGLTQEDEDRLEIFQRTDGEMWTVVSPSTQERDSDLNWVAADLELHDGRAEVALGLQVEDNGEEVCRKMDEAGQLQ